MNIFQEKKEPVLFQFGIDETGSAYLQDTVRWTKFLAIMGFVFTGILLLGAVGFLYAGGFKMMVPVTGYVLAYVLIAVLYLYPVLALYRFSVMTKKAIAQADSFLFNAALRQQRNLYRYIGILLIITLLLYGFVACYIALTGLSR